MPATSSSGARGPGAFGWLPNVVDVRALEGHTPMQPMLGSAEAGGAHAAQPLDARETLAAVSELAARSFPTIDEAVEATLDVMRRLLNMEVRMVNQVDGDQLTFRYQQLPTDFPDLRGMATPLN